MVIYTNPITLPILVLIWSMDAWIWLAAIRIFLCRVESSYASQISRAIAQVTDPITELVSRTIRHFTPRRLPQWLLLLVTALAMITVRQLLLSIVLLTQPLS